MNFGPYWNSLHLLPTSLWSWKWNCCSKRFAHVLVIDIVIISQSLQSCEITAKPTRLIYLNAILESRLLQDSPMHHYGLPYDRLLDMELILLSQHDIHISGTFSYYICLDLTHFLLPHCTLSHPILVLTLSIYTILILNLLTRLGVGRFNIIFFDAKAASNCFTFFVLQFHFCFAILFFEDWISKYNLSNLSSFVGKNHSHFHENKHIK
jgi:hypothetical protein